MPNDPPEAAHFSGAEEQAVRRAWLASGAADCPRCGIPMRNRPISGGSFGLGYQRQRQWLMCPRCKRSVLFDADRGTRT